ncbi:TPA: carboxymuconolactone decarboxylase family protein [Photobacterium damselae]|uniref:Carboxymuconolactone decarboxylase family protein n=1 Tax=Photobacterium damselae subsp. damselae TaxID=85581 RepID=A0AAD3ZUL7_PHODD|nr:carboxymuconolactone decarboxylase family protein [Photobacterium damselae]EHA1081990.1 carboxymuconolactone decarboxylase family protein [Photobacterium damselae]KAB1179115.1 carboxymuconolactone decarboxylase family protein [Photobacterium damselae subsp. damselae]MBA5684081.1 carboxymuconolactone decarboxylase family protein [Photobacterium damselae subsp. damselae]MCG3812010.1 carboxymuconolactone decarboxylase family protein [Photobacterium damselae]NVH49182.1 carboxymuconolactone deca
MQHRFDLSALEPKAYKPMLGLEGYLDQTDLEPKLKELIKIRSSIINGCAFCIQMHTDKAKSLGETDHRLFAVAAWKESPLFTDEERAVLALTDEVTEIAKGGVSEEVYQACIKLMGEHKTAQCLMQIVTINAWNRIALTTRMYHEAE